MDSFFDKGSDEVRTNNDDKFTILKGWSKVWFSNGTSQASSIDKNALYSNIPSAHSLVYNITMTGKTTLHFPVHRFMSNMAGWLAGTCGSKMPGLNGNLNAFPLVKVMYSTTWT